MEEWGLIRIVLTPRMVIAFVALGISLTKNNGVKLIFRASVLGQRIVKTIGSIDSTLDSLNTALLRIQAKIDFLKGDTPAPLTLANFIAIYYLPHSKIIHRDHLGQVSRLNVIEPYCNSINDKLLQDITKFNCIQVINSLRLREVSPETINKYRYALQSVFSFALEMELIEKNPLKTIRKEKVNNKQTRVLRGTELERFLALSMTYPNPYAGLSLALLVCSGMRAMEALSLKWSFISECGGFAMLPMDKAGNGRVVYLNKASQEILSKLKAIKVSEYVFHSERTGGHLSYPRAALLQITQQLDQEGVLAGSCSLHSLRHTFATHLIEATGSLLDVTTALGHKSSATVTERYCHLSSTHMVASVCELDSIFSTQVNSI